ncbi:hypothetical protein GCM10009762_04880 [Dermacoccus barathri]|uniref:Uncharacterized protein n=1 Tax=Dermacoccus barathri TaxID=322601 RepID=A0ABN2B4V0_9MICO
MTPGRLGREQGVVDQPENPRSGRCVDHVNGARSRLREVLSDTSVARIAVVEDPKEADFP